MAIAQISLGSIVSGLIDAMAAIRPIAALSVSARILGNVLISSGGLVGSYEAVKYLIATYQIQQSRDEMEARVKATFQSAGISNVLFHYTDAIGMIGILSTSSIRATSGFSSWYPPGAYATTISPWAVDYTQATLSALFRGGFEGYPFTHWVAFAGPDFSEIPGTMQWWRPAPPLSMVPIEVLEHGSI